MNSHRLSGDQTIDSHAHPMSTSDKSIPRGSACAVPVTRSMISILACGDPTRTAAVAPSGEITPTVDCTAPSRRVLSGYRTPVHRSITTGRQRAWLPHSAVSQRVGPSAAPVHPHQHHPVVVGAARYPQVPRIRAGERRPACVQCPGCRAGRLFVRDEVTRYEVDRADQRALRVGYERHRPAAQQRWVISPGDAAAGELNADDHPGPVAEQLPAATTNSSNFGRRRRRKAAPTPRSGPASRNSTSSGGTSSPRLMHPLSSRGLFGLLVNGSATAAPWTSPWLPPGYEQNLARQYRPDDSRTRRNVLRHHASRLAQPPLSSRCLAARGRVSAVGPTAS